MRRAAVAMLIVALCPVMARAVAQESCTMRATEGKLSVRWESASCAEGRECREGDSDMAWSRWAGVAPGDLEREGAALDARMRADAGEMRCVGTVHGGALRGEYTFTPDEEFRRRMEALGFAGVTTSRQQGYVMLDVSLAWVRAMKDAGVKEMTTENLMGLRALDVSPDYVRGMARAGYPELRAERLTAMRAVGVTPEKVASVRALGYSPTEDELIQMSVFKVDAAFVQRMKGRGFHDPTIAELLKIKIFKLDE